MRHGKRLVAIAAFACIVTATPHSAGVGGAEAHAVRRHLIETRQGIADPNHIVTADGFPVTNLDQKLNETTAEEDGSLVRQ